MKLWEVFHCQANSTGNRAFLCVRSPEPGRACETGGLRTPFVQPSWPRELPPSNFGAGCKWQGMNLQRRYIYMENPWAYYVIKPDSLDDIEMDMEHSFGKTRIFHIPVALAAAEAVSWRDQQGLFDWTETKSSLLLAQISASGKFRKALRRHQDAGPRPSVSLYFAMAQNGDTPKIHSMHRPIV